MGDLNGRLGLLQIGVETTTYLVDVILFPGAIAALKRHLENPGLTKYIWDARSDYSELLHGHGVTMKGLVFLQLVCVRSQSSTGKTVHLSSMSDAAQKLSVTTPQILSLIRARMSDNSNWYLASAGT